MRKMMKWALACALCILIMTCSDSLDSGDGASQQPNAAEEIAKETFIHEEWMDRSVKPGDSFWDFALGTWLKGNEMNGPMMSIGLSGPVILGKALQRLSWQQPYGTTH